MNEQIAGPDGQPFAGGGQNHNIKVKIHPTGQKVLITGLTDPCELRPEALVELGVFLAQIGITAGKARALASQQAALAPATPLVPGKC